VCVWPRTCGQCGCVCLGACATLCAHDGGTHQGHALVQRVPIASSHTITISACAGWSLGPGVARMLLCSLCASQPSCISPLSRVTLANSLVFRLRLASVSARQQQLLLLFCSDSHSSIRCVAVTRHGAAGSLARRAAQQRAAGNMQWGVFTIDRAVLCAKSSCDMTDLK
jgi:hypothetical protein